MAFSVTYLCHISAYTLPVKFSSSEQQFSLQVDTGSSDLVKPLCLFTVFVLTFNFSVDSLKIMF